MTTFELYRNSNRLPVSTPIRGLFWNTRLKEHIIITTELEMFYIAYLGWTHNLSYFSKCFKEKFGVSVQRSTTPKPSV